ncbi:hypothetical protein ACHAW5_000714 [Stephanodiscus triporus]|uniref:Saccharopine dehydrogenase NADP binding domain-containing protein n=1 Tax=Stephanodiscus triporus TaxID=2934178 RepID=A0ABD3N1J4_9STRA
MKLDVDGDPTEIADALRRWKFGSKEGGGRGGGGGTTTTTGTDDGDDRHLVVHTAGPFQGRRSPNLLSSCIDMSIPYVDVCDEWELAESSKLEYHARAMEANVPCVVSAGIWPGVSALMAAEGVSRLDGMMHGGDGRGDGGGGAEVESVDYSFFTAGTGNAGPTIVSATFLLLATEALTYLDGKRVDVEPWTGRKDVDFGGNVGSRPVWLLDNPDVPTTALYLDGTGGGGGGRRRRVRNCSSRFGTAPLFWNFLFGAMKALPRSLLYDRDAMQCFSLFSGPIIRLVDKLVGSTNAMRVDIVARTRTGGEEGGGRRGGMTLRMAHPDLESCVGLATAAFVLEVLGAGVVEDDGAEGGRNDYDDDDDRRAGRVVPGRVGEVGEDEYIEDAFVYELGESFQLM